MTLAKTCAAGYRCFSPTPAGYKAAFTHCPDMGLPETRVWNISEQDQNSITLQLASDGNTKTVYPFDFRLELAVAVSGNQLSHTMTLKNTGDRPMPTAYGIHPYFKIAPDRKIESDS